MHLEDRHASCFVRSIDQHLPVKASGAQQRRVEDLRPVRRGEQHDPNARVEPVHLGQQLI